MAANTSQTMVEKLGDNVSEFPVLHNSKHQGSAMISEITHVMESGRDTG